MSARSSVRSRITQPWRGAVIVAAILVAPPLTFVARAAIAPTPVADLGFVLEAIGKWQVASGTAAPRALVAGQTVKAGDRLLAGAADDRLVVVMLDGSRLACPSDARCAAPLGNGRSEGKPTVARRLLRAISGLFSQPERYATTMSRGEELHEAVGVIRKRRLDLGEALTSLPAGNYRVTLQGIDGKGVASGDSYDFDFAITGSGASQKFVGQPTSHEPRLGLYRASLESGADAWIVLAGSGNVHVVREHFAAAQAVARAFGKEVSARATRSFLRAALDGIANDKAR